MCREIPSAAISVCTDIVSTHESHATLDNLFTYAGVPGEPPPGSKPAKALAWLRAINRGQSVDPLRIFGRLIEGYMERPLDPENPYEAPLFKLREKLSSVLAEHGLQYAKGGHITGAFGVPTRTLREHGFTVARLRP